MAGISYELRPSKAVVRRIFVEMLRRLQPIESFSNYQYVGFGALEFLDFDMVHRVLGIHKMTSIEDDGGGIDRYRWNRPFSTIEVLAGRSSTVLPSLDWTGPSIVWLDYTSTLSRDVMQDVENMIRVLRPGSALCVTLNCHPKRLSERREDLENAIGPENVPIGVTDNRLGAWGLAETQYEVLSGRIASEVASRRDQATWRQVLNVRYQDNARMQMLAGLVSDASVDGLLPLCRFEELAEVRRGADALTVRVPILTPREQDWLNQRLPTLDKKIKIALPGVSEKDVEAYHQVYRWLAPSR